MTVDRMIGWSERNESDIMTVDRMMVRDTGVFENTLSRVSSSSFNEIPRDPNNDLRSPCCSGEHKSTNFGDNIKTVIPAKTKRGCYNRRKNIFTVTKFTSTLIDDGYAWRKYGQKEILNSKYQRNYYRCSHKFEQGCQATKQVQKTDEKPSKYKIRYYGLHTCNNLQNSPQIIMEDPTPMNNSMILNFETNTIVENNKVGTCYPSIKHAHKKGFHSLYHLEHEQVSSYDHRTPWDPIVGFSQVSSEPMSSMMLSRLDHEEMVSPGVFLSTCNTNGNEIDDIIKNYDFGDFFSELWS